MRVRAVAGLIAGAVAVLAAAPAAGAATLYVATTGSDQSNDCRDPSKRCKTIGHAVDESDPGDTISIAAGKYIERVTADHALSLVGAGSGIEAGPETVIEGPTPLEGPGQPAFDLPNGGVLESLAAEGGDGDGEDLKSYQGAPGVRFVSSSAAGAGIVLRDVDVVGGASGGDTPLPPIGPPGLLVSGEHGPKSVLVEDSRVQFGSGFPTDGPAAVVTGPTVAAQFRDSALIGSSELSVGSAGLLLDGSAEADLVDSQALGFSAVAVHEGFAEAQRSLLIGLAVGVLVEPFGAPDEAAAWIRNSLALAREGYGAYVRGGPAASYAGLLSVGSTIVSEADEEGAGLEANRAGDLSGQVDVKLQNSIVEHVSEGPAPPVDISAINAIVHASHSNYSVVVKNGSALVPEPGTATNIGGPPGFVDPNKLNFGLVPSSPLVDRGDPAFPNLGPLDFEGRPRSVDGNGDCIAAPDIGAYELTGHETPCPAGGGSGGGGAPAPAEKKGAKGGPKVSDFGMSRRVLSLGGGGTQGAVRFTYRLSVPARVTISIERKAAGRKVRRGGKVRCVPAGRQAKPRCVRWVKVGALRARGKAGTQSLPFDGRLGGKTLKPGQYRATIVATDQDGQRSQPRRVSFRVVRG